MKRIIHHLRLQPPEFRMMVAVLGALLVTLLIGALWAFAAFSPRTPSDNPATPGPLSALVASIRGTITHPQGSSPDSSSPNTVQVIDAGADTPNH